MVSSRSLQRHAYCQAKPLQGWPLTHKVNTRWNYVMLRPWARKACCIWCPGHLPNASRRMSFCWCAFCRRLRVEMPNAEMRFAKITKCRNVNLPTYLFDEVQKVETSICRNANLPKPPLPKMQVCRNAICRYVSLANWQFAEMSITQKVNLPKYQFDE